MSKVTKNKENGTDKKIKRLEEEKVNVVRELRLTYILIGLF